MSYNTWKILYLWYKCFKGIRAFPALVSSQVLSVKKLFLKLFGIGVNSRGRVCSFTLQNRFLYTKWYLTIKKIISSHKIGITHVQIKGKITIPRKEQWTNRNSVDQRTTTMNSKIDKIWKKNIIQSKFKQYNKGKKGFHEPDWRDEREKTWKGDN